MFEGLKAPEIEVTGWLNSQPLRLKDLRDRVVLLNIWDYTCINCIRSLPYLAEWHERYSPSGLVIIGIHCPEFDFARDRRNVERALRRFGLKYPIALDNDYRVWNSYANRYWPREFLIDRRGVIRHDHVGEGDYRQTEIKVQELLGELNPTVLMPEPVEDEDGENQLRYPVTAELYAGYQRGRLGNPEGYRPNKVVDYSEVARSVDGFIYVKGKWLNLAQCLQYAGGQGWIGLRYHAVSVNAVISTVGPPSWPIEVEVEQDGRSLTPEIAGEDVMIEQGRGLLRVKHPRMYRLATNGGFGYHILKLHTASEIFRLHAFTFGGYEIRRQEPLVASLA
ncbi:MAG: redoxin domain-containing protein, partial [Pseudomonadota bacterium]